MVKFFRFFSPTLPRLSIHASRSFSHSQACHTCMESPQNVNSFPSQHVSVRQEMSSPGRRRDARRVSKFCAFCHFLGRLCLAFSPVRPAVFDGPGTAICHFEAHKMAVLQNPRKSRSDHRFAIYDGYKLRFGSEKFFDRFPPKLRDDYLP